MNRDKAITELDQLPFRKAPNGYLSNEPVDLRVREAIKQAQADMTEMKSLDGFSREWPKCPECAGKLETWHEDEDLPPRWRCEDCEKWVAVQAIRFHKVVGIK